MKIYKPEILTLTVVGGISSVATSCLWHWAPRLMTVVTGILISALFVCVIIYVARDIYNTPAGHSGD